MMGGDGHGRHRAVVAPKRLSGVVPSQARRVGRAGMLKLVGFGKGLAWAGGCFLSLFSSKKQETALSIEN